MLAAMCQSTRVQLRARGIIATSLTESGIPISDDVLDVAKRIIKDMTAAGLVTVIGTDLAGFVRGIKDRHAAG